MVLKANDRRTSCPCHDEFRGPRSDYVRQRDADHPNPTRAPWVTYSANKQAKEEIACVGLNRSLEQALEHMGVQLSC
ncbi:hypothetical protein TNCV_4406171 [Trichonephila clavipes]|nr:hypothetical protein TNCV_4406171 [Trichonephila clavipes]